MRSLVAMSLLLAFTLGCNSKQRSTSTTTPPSSSTQAPESALNELCGHVMELMRREFGDNGVTGVPLTEEEQAKFLSSCAGDFEAEREKIGAERFDAYVTCVMAAATMSDYIACDEQDD